MIGRELMIYILENGLEDEEIFKDGKFIGFMTAEEAAVKFDVGVQTIIAWISTGVLQVVKIGDTMFIPQNATNPKERIQNEEKNMVEPDSLITHNNFSVNSVSTNRYLQYQRKNLKR